MGPWLPTTRTLRKFARDLGAYLIAMALVYVADHTTELGLNPAQTALVVPVVLLLLRMVRGGSGREP